jgi:hypothetical protein
MFWIVALVIVAVVVGGAVWWRRRRLPSRQLYSADYERARGQGYLQAQHTRNDLNGPFQGSP